ncbi:MAG TPA: acetyl-CoA hydrolase/transferase C-terminal domain-containing protein, partial [Kiloniellales bacterium]|nr:acetyl-CoA hydrolase/transferase C-terminal domain-containing protein [Kiloniellales bacterium]
MGQMGMKAARRMTAGEAAALVRSGDWVDYGFGLGQPDLFDKALAARQNELEGVKIRAALSLRPRQVLEVDREGRHFQWFNWHFSGYDRRQHDAGLANYIPMNFGEAPDFYRRFIDPVDLVVIKTCPRDATGTYNFSGSCSYHAALVERARKVVVEVDERLPYCHGPGNGVHESRVDGVIEGENFGPPEIANPPPSDIDRTIAGHIAAEVEDGACLQIGIGAMPNAVCSTLKDAGVKDLGVHTEMLVDGLIDLYEAGAVTNARKTLNPGVITYTFAAGSRRQYDFLHDNKALETWPVDYTNLPHNIMQNERVVSVNNTTQMDLQGQAASESDGHRHISGTGGQLQFVRGAYASKGGKSFVCLSSTYDKGRDGQRRSRIVVGLTPGNVVT